MPYIFLNLDYQIQRRKKPTHKQDVYMNRKVFKTILNWQWLNLGLLFHLKSPKFCSTTQKYILSLNKSREDIPSGYILEHSKYVSYIVI